MTDTFSILLVEDSPDDAYFFERALRRASIPCDFHHASDGKAAIELLGANAKANSLPQAVFLDLKMPVMNGFEVLEWLEQQPFASDLPVFVLSGSNQQSDRERARLLGAADYLVKPVTSEILADKLHALRNAQGVTP